MLPQTRRILSALDRADIKRKPYNKVKHKTIREYYTTPDGVRRSTIIHQGSWIICGPLNEIQEALILGDKTVRATKLANDAGARYVLIRS